MFARSSRERGALVATLAVLLVACSSGSHSSAGSKPRSSSTVVESGDWNACNAWWISVRRPGRPGFTAAVQMAKNAGDTELASLMASSNRGSTLLQGAEATVNYCHSHGWPWGTVNQPDCEKWSEWVAMPDGVAQMEKVTSRVAALVA